MHESSLFVDTAVGQALLPASPLNQFSQPLSTVRHRHRRLPSVTPTGRKCPPQPHPEAAVPPAMALFGLWAAGTPAVGGRGALQAPLGSGPSCPRALAASSEEVSQPGCPTVQDIHPLTAECLRRTSRGQAQETGLPV